MKTDLLGNVVEPVADDADKGFWIPVSRAGGERRIAFVRAVWREKGATWVTVENIEGAFRDVALATVKRVAR